jgi:hypothetical protein
MSFNPDDPGPQNREYPVREEGRGNGGTFGIIIVMAAMATAGTSFCFASITAAHTWP